MDRMPHFKNLTRQELAGRIRDQLVLDEIPRGWDEGKANGASKGSAVMFLITSHAVRPDLPPEPCLLLNKRSAEVLQPGDLCCPGGGVEPYDKLLARMMHWPFSPLQKWPSWKKWQRRYKRSAETLATLLTAGLREGWEEMRLNPFQVTFLGCLPVQKLVMFERHIYPLVAWSRPNQRLVPNWEVERIVHIPLRRLMDPRHYGRYNLTFHTRQSVVRREQQFPCFIHQGRNGREVLWGATFRITMDFLKIVFGFDMPDLDGAPEIDGQLGGAYLGGSRMAVHQKIQEE